MNHPRLPRKAALAAAAAAIVLAIGGGAAASADTTGFGFGPTCTANSPGGTAPPDACDTVGVNGGHGIDIHTQNPQPGSPGFGPGFQALCVYDYLGNPSSCLQTLGAAFNGFGRTTTGTNDGDTIDSYGNGDVFTPTNRMLSNGGLVVGGGKTPAPAGQSETDPSGDIAFCPAGDLVGDSTHITNPACQHLTGSDVTKLHAIEAAPGWSPVGYANGWNTRPGYSALAVRRKASPPDDVEIAGQISGGTWRNGVQIATLPAGFAPTTEQVVQASCVNGSQCVITVEPGGQVDLWGPSSTNIAQVGASTYVTGR